MNIERAFLNEKETIPVNADFDFSTYGGEDAYFGVVRVNGCVSNRNGIVSLEYTAVYDFTRPCDRCACDISKHVSHDFSHVLVPVLEDEGADEIIEVPGYELELESLVYSDILLELPMKYLCSEDCKGLCPKCGTNLNEGACGCDAKTLDPRLAVLRELL